MNKYDRRRKYWLILDCETATLPYASNLADPEQKKRVAIAKPLIYDLGWKVVDKIGRVYARKNFLITEIFSVPDIFDTAYYAEKRPLYLDRLKNGEITLTTWAEAVEELVADLDAVEAIGAYNSMFDYKKALPFTELYINMLYSPEYHKWLHYQDTCCAWLAQGGKPTSKKEFEHEIFRFRGKTYKMFDLWGLSCKYILNCDEYKQMCIDNQWETESGKYFKTSAETTFRFFSQNLEFDEAHTAIEDCDIEAILFAEIVRITKGKWEMGIEFFPFRILGTVAQYKALHEIL